MDSQVEARIAASDRLIERGPIEKRIPEDIEASAVEIFERQTLATTGHKWSWDAASNEVRNRFRLEAFTKAYYDGTRD